MRDLKIFATAYVVCAVVLGVFVAICHATEFDIILESVPMETDGTVAMPLKIFAHSPNVGAKLDNVILGLDFDTETLVFDGFTYSDDFAGGYVDVNENPPFAVQCAGPWTTVQTSGNLDNKMVLLSNLGGSPNGVLMPPHPQQVAHAVSMGTLNFHHARTEVPEGGYATAVKVDCRVSYNGLPITEFSLRDEDNTVRFYGWGLSGSGIYNGCVSIGGGQCAGAPSQYSDCSRRCPNTIEPPKPDTGVRAMDWGRIRGLYR